MLKSKFKLTLLAIVLGGLTNSLMAATLPKNATTDQEISYYFTQYNATVNKTGFDNAINHIVKNVLPHNNPSRQKQLVQSTINYLSNYLPNVQNYYAQLAKYS